jgi:assimilatory nitrate reductase catalytic subunit
VAQFAATWYAFAVTTTDTLPATAYAARARVAGGWRMELADRAQPADWEHFARGLFGLPDATAISVIDRRRGLTRVALMDGGRLAAAIFAGPDPVAVSREHLAALLGHHGSDALAGRPGADRPDPGPTLCSCLNIGVNTILTAIETEGLLTVAAIGAALGAGTNCGSCKPEIAALLARTPMRQAAE